jgi:Ca2+-binding RTX toxin-like protein
VIYGSSQADTVSGAGGDDTLFGKAGNDILDGGTGNDLLQGEAGDDLYRFGRGSGQDTIVDLDATPGNVDAVEMAAGRTRITDYD